VKYIFILCLLNLGVATAQINQTDAEGKKNGKWIVYLDKDWGVAKDTSLSAYRRFTYYDHGTNIYPMGKCGGKNFKLESSNLGSLLDGEYKWYDGKGKLSSVHVFKNGKYVSCKEYYPNGKLRQHFDYTKKCEGQDLGWTVYVYDKKGNLILTSPTCKDKEGHWPNMR
jgi:antitoxin component YwqK of YwqJK toxin-antitoxin module